MINMFSIGTDSFKEGILSCNETKTENFFKTFINNFPLSKTSLGITSLKTDMPEFVGRLAKMSLPEILDVTISACEPYLMPEDSFVHIKDYQSQIDNYYPVVSLSWNENTFDIYPKKLFYRALKLWLLMSALYSGSYNTCDGSVNYDEMIQRRSADKTVVHTKNTHKNVEKEKNRLPKEIMPACFWNNTEDGYDSQELDVQLITQYLLERNTAVNFSHYIMRVKVFGTDLKNLFFKDFDPEHNTDLPENLLNTLALYPLQHYRLQLLEGIILLNNPDESTASTANPLGKYLNRIAEDLKYQCFVYFPLVDMLFHCLLKLKYNSYGNRKTLTGELKTVYESWPYQKGTHRLVYGDKPGSVVGKDITIPLSDGSKLTVTCNRLVDPYIEPPSDKLISPIFVYNRDITYDFSKCLKAAFGDSFDKINNIPGPVFDEFIKKIFETRKGFVSLQRFFKGPLIVNSEVVPEEYKSFKEDYIECRDIVFEKYIDMVQKVDIDCFIDLIEEITKPFIDRQEYEYLFDYNDDTGFEPLYWIHREDKELFGIELEELEKELKKFKSNAEKQIKLYSADKFNHKDVRKLSFALNDSLLNIKSLLDSYRQCQWNLCTLLKFILPKGFYKPPLVIRGRSRKRRLKKRYLIKYFGIIELEMKPKDGKFRIAKLEFSRLTKPTLQKKVTDYQNNFLKEYTNNLKKDYQFKGIDKINIDEFLKFGEPLFKVKYLDFNNPELKIPKLIWTIEMINGCFCILPSEDDYKIYREDLINRIKNESPSELKKYGRSAILDKFREEVFIGFDKYFDDFAIPFVTQALSIDKLINKHKKLRDEFQKVIYENMNFSIPNMAKGDFLFIKAKSNISKQFKAKKDKLEKLEELKEELNKKFSKFNSNDMYQLVKGIEYYNYINDNTLKNFHDFKSVINYLAIKKEKTKDFRRKENYKALTSQLNTK